MPVLSVYVAATQALLQTPPAPTPLYSDAQLTGYINTARGQIAGEAACIRFYTVLPVTSATRVYPFSSISLSGRSDLAGVINVRTIWRVIGGGPGSVTGQVWMTPRPFEWFSLYETNNAAPALGPPQKWAQFGQGAGQPFFGTAIGGSIWIDPMPDANYTLALDTVCYPVPLVDDTTVDSIPFLWSDAVPYFAAYMALLAAQSPARQADALRYFGIYTEFMTRARRFSTPGLLPWQNPQAAQPTMQNQLGLAGQQGAAA